MHIRAHECSWMLMSSHQHSWAWCQDTHEPEWVLIGNHEQSYALLSMVPWHSKHSWALMSSNEHSRALLAPWQLIHNCSWVPTNAHERSWVLKTAHYCSWLLKSLIKKKTHKMLIFKWPSYSNLQISRSRFHQMIQMWTFSNSTWKGQLKNV